MVLKSRHENFTAVSLNRCVSPLVVRLRADLINLRLKMIETATGVTLIDAGIDAVGGIEAGLRISEICLAGLGRVALHALPPPTPPPMPMQNSTWAAAFQVTVSSSNPIMACLASQYAGWTLEHSGFYALGSGPARALWAEEALFTELAYKDEYESAVLVIETDRIPPDLLLRDIVARLGIRAENLTVILTPTTSLAGGVQVVARSLEVALHKAHELKFPLDLIIDGVGTAPLPPPSQDFLTAMGRTNDAILYGGTVQLFVKGEESLARTLAEKLPSSTSADYGKPFSQIFKDSNFDFYKIDPMLFSPALVMVTAVDSGKSFVSGRHNLEVLTDSFSVSRL